MAGEKAMNIKFMIEIVPLLIKATKYTISLSVISLVISLLIAIFISAIIYHKVKILSSILKVYVSFFRGTPALCQLYMIYFGLANCGIEFLAKMSPYTAVVIALSVNMSAYMAENLRGALSSVEKGQSEAGMSIGLSKVQIFSHIVFPQAFRVAVPSLGNSFVDLVKGSSMAFTIGVAELMATANMQGNATYNFLEAFFMAAVIYWMLTLVINMMQKQLEKYLGKAY